jgi:hypothetical protein
MSRRWSNVTPARNVSLEEGTMLFYCRFTWYPGTSRDEVARRVIQQDELGTNHPERIKGWYTLVGGGAGFLMIEGSSAQDVSEILEPYMDLMAWDVHAVSMNSYDETLAELKRQVT